METKQLNGYKVEFYSEEEWNEEIDIAFGITTFGKIKLWKYKLSLEGKSLNFKREKDNYEYAGLATEIPEELAEKIVSSWQCYESLSLDVIYNGYIDYKSSSHYEYAKYPFRDAKDSFKTLSDLPYCVITKID